MDIDEKNNQMMRGKRSRERPCSSDNGIRDAGGIATISETRPFVDPPVPNTTKVKFNSLIRAKVPCVDWVGTYTKAHSTAGIEIGFIKKEAMAMTTLLSYYQSNGEHACPVAMVSGQASIGRKLAIFYSPGADPHGWSGCWRMAYVRMPLDGLVKSQAFSTLAMTGRADYYMGALQSYLDEGLERNRKKGKMKGDFTLQVTFEGKLLLDQDAVMALGARGRKSSREGVELWNNLRSFHSEVFEFNQRDIADVLLKYMEFPNPQYLISKTLKNGHFPLLLQLVESCPFLPRCLDDLRVMRMLLFDAIEGQNADAVQYLLDRGVEVDGWFGVETPLVKALHVDYRVKRPGSMAVVKVLLAAGADVTEVFPGSAPDWKISALTTAIGVQSRELVELITSHFPRDRQPVDLNLEVGARMHTHSKAWLIECGLVLPGP